jgi:hypothetical protein
MLKIKKNCVNYILIIKETRERAGLPDEFSFETTLSSDNQSRRRRCNSAHETATFAPVYRQELLSQVLLHTNNTKNCYLTFT